MEKTTSLLIQNWFTPAKMLLEGIDFAKQILEEHQDVDGIFAITDLVAVGVLSYFNDNKNKVPQQVAVIGFSNWFMSQVLTPKLSTVDQPSHLMGAFNLLWKK
jgi:LacI family transcriptional regulator